VSDEVSTALSALSSAFGSLGRIIVCLDRDFRIVYASEALQDLIGGAASGWTPGIPIGELLDADLFAEGGTIREALVAGERREGWRAFLRGHDGPRLISLSAAPLRGTTPFQGTVAYLVVLRPADPAAGEADQIRAALESARWRRDVAAASLHMSRTTLWRKMREYGLLRSASS
jgi:PAS domain-containing protein